MILAPILQSYSAGNVIVTIGAFIFSSFNEVTVQQDQPTWKFKKGCYGSYARVKSLSKLGTITLSLPQTAVGNAYNSWQSLALNTSKNDSAVVPVLITDLWGGSLHAMANGTIIKMPKSTYSKNPIDRQWIIQGELDVDVLAQHNLISNLINV